MPFPLLSKFLKAISATVVILSLVGCDLRFADRVKLTVTDTDQYGRKVSEVRLPNGTFIQEVLLKEGLVQVYKPYLKNCPSASIVQAAEADAKKRRVGVWRDTKYVPAWEWRRNNK